MTKNNKNVFESLSFKNIAANKAVAGLVITCASEANVPVDCVSPKKRKRINRPDAKIPTKKMSLHDENETLLKFFNKSRLKKIKAITVENNSEKMTLCVANKNGSDVCNRPNLSTIPIIPKQIELRNAKRIP